MSPELPSILGPSDLDVASQTPQCGRGCLDALFDCVAPRPRAKLSPDGAQHPDGPMMADTTQAFFNELLQHRRVGLGKQLLPSGRDAVETCRLPSSVALSPYVFHKAIPPQRGDVRAHAVIGQRQRLGEGGGGLPRAAQQSEQL